MGKKTDLKDSCAYCGVTNCIDLFRHRKEDGELVGGELYVYKQLNHSRVVSEGLTMHVCSNGKLLQCACFIVGPAYVGCPDHYLTNISVEIVRDMKASFYLAMSGHYRQAILIQRCVFENFLYGLYFHTEDYFFSKTDDERKQIQKTFMSWMEGGFRRSDDYLLDIIRRGGLITDIEKRDWRKLYSQLSQFVHTILHTPTGKTIKYGDAEVRGCEAVVEFNKDSLIEWSNYYQKVFFLVLHKLLILYPFVKNEEAGKLALKFIRAEFKDARDELANPYLDSLLRMRAGRSSAKNLSN
jgi:hypothetical protein